LLNVVHLLALPREAVSVIKGSVFPDEQRGPAMADVLDTLAARDIEMDAFQLKVLLFFCTVLSAYYVSLTQADADVSAVHEWIKSQTRPVIVLHHQPEEMYSSTRRLSHFSVEGSNTTTTVPLTEAQISQYQVCL
jgi:hypothetical protein